MAHTSLQPHPYGADFGAKPDAPPAKLKVLVVDDQAIQRTIVRRALQKMGHEVVEADSGEAALRLIEEQDITMIVCDWVMDGMDGVALCRHLRSRSEGRYAYFILMSARDGREDLIAGIQAGADDFLRKPVDVDELGVRLRSGQRVLDLQAGMERRNRQLTDAYAQIQRDIDAAGVFQKGLLPDSTAVTNGTQLGWLFLPSNLVSGDALNHFRLDDDHLGFYVLDVAGHGVASAMVAMIVTQYLNPRISGCLYQPQQLSSALVVNDPAATVRALNDQLMRQGIGSNYLTCIYGVLNRRTGKVRLVRAGHTLPVIVQADGALEVIDVEGDFPVGMFEGVDFHNIEFTLPPGARLCLYSDGITECENLVGEQYGLERLTNALVARRDQPVADFTAAFAAEMRAWTGQAQATFDDDVSMLLLEFQPGKASSLSKPRDLAQTPAFPHPQAGPAPQPGPAYQEALT